MPVVLWLVAWGVMTVLWKDKSVNFRGAITTTFVLIGLGLLGTFPIFFQMFAG